MSARTFRYFDEVLDTAFRYQNWETVQMYFPKENTCKEEVVIFDTAFDDNTYNVVNDVVAFIYQCQYYVIPYFFGIQIILETSGFQRDKGLRVFFSSDFAVPLRGSDEWLELLRDMYETNHTWSRQSRYMPEEASSIDERFLARSYIYSTRYTENIGKYNYDQKLIVFYYYDGKIYVTGDYTIIKELDSHGFVRDETIEIPVLDK